MQIIQPKQTLLYNYLDKHPGESPTWKVCINYVRNIGHKRFVNQTLMNPLGPVMIK